MSFLYTTPAGAIDLAALMLMSGLAAWFGPFSARAFAAAMCAVFLIHRYLMMTQELASMMAFGGLVDVMAALIVTALVPGFLGRAMGFLFASKAAIYLTVVTGQIDFDAMATGITVIVYFQFLVILATVAHGGFGKRLRGRSASGPADYRGNSVMARRVLPK